MAITANFDKDENENRRDGKVLMRVPAAQNMGEDTPALKPVVHGAYLWDLSPRRRSGKSWRDITALN